MIFKFATLIVYTQFLFQNSLLPIIVISYYQAYMKSFVSPLEQHLFALQQQKLVSLKTEQSIKIQEQTAIKNQQAQLSEAQNIKIRNQVFSLFKNNVLKGHIKIQNFQSLEQIQVVFYHKINQYKVQQNIKITFNKEYPKIPPSLYIHSCNLTQKHSEYTVPNFLTMNQLLNKEMWSAEIKLADVLAKIYETIDDYHKSQVERLLSPVRSQQILEKSDLSLSNMEDIQSQNQRAQEPKRSRRKSSNMTGCADKQLTQTKNLNRHFRSKLRQVLRDLVPDPENTIEDSKMIEQIFTPNRVGFEDIRKALCNKWFNEGVRRQMNSGQFLHKILRGMMGIKSKKLMIKYYHVMASAVEDPQSFIRWKYE